MTLAFFLKLTGELSYFYFFGSLIPHLMFGQGLRSALPPLLFAAIGAACYGLHQAGKPRKRYALPLLGLALIGALLARSLTDAALLALPAAYLCWFVWTGRFGLRYSDVASLFITELKILAPATLFVLFTTAYVPLDPMALPMLLLFLLSTVMLLRMLRHEPAVLRQRRFLITNAITVAVVLALVAFFASPVTTQAALSLLGGFYRVVLMPILSLFGYVLAAVMWVVVKLISLLRIKLTPKENPNAMDDIGMPDSPFADMQGDLADTTVLQHILLGVFMLALLILAVLFFRRLARRLSQSMNSGGPVQTRAVLAGQPLARPRLDAIPPKEPRAAVRYYYRKFLRLCGRMGAAIMPADTTDHIRRSMSAQLPDSTLDGLRELYIRARYSQGEIAPADADRAKEHYQTLRKAEREFQRELKKK